MCLSARGEGVREGFQTSLSRSCRPGTESRGPGGGGAAKMADRLALIAVAGRQPLVAWGWQESGEPTPGDRERSREQGVGRRHHD